MFPVLKHFKESENWGDPSKMNPELLQALDLYRDLAGTPIQITSGYRAKDPKQHGQGRAVDIIFPRLRLADLFEMWLVATRIPEFKGIGFYPYWRAQADGPFIGGLHLDNREVPTRAYWMGIPDPNGSGNRYLVMNSRNLKEHYFSAF